MSDKFPTEQMIRQYLLGRFDDQGDMEDHLSRQMFLDSELSEIVDSIEDEIIEEYVDGRVSAADKKAIEEYFLRPPERKEKVQLALLLRRQFGTKGQALAKKKLNADRPTIPGPVGDRSSPLPILHRQTHFRTYCELAAGILLIAAGFIYASRISREWQSQLEATRKSQTQLEGELAQERQRSADLEKQLEQVHPPMATLTFLGPIFRAAAATRAVEIRPWTQRIRVEIGLRGKSAGDYDVHLENGAGKAVWSQSKITASSGGLRFDMPIEGISTGTYCLIVSSQPDPYCFQARVTKN